MARELKSADEIQAEVSGLIHDIREIREDGAVVKVPKPTELRELDDAGCNWTMLTFGGAATSYVQGILRVVENVRVRYNLRP